ncbi:MOXD1 homolog 1 [Coccinella septempunctata]|uniref:MOXD1 homolog 1 n=1 Tax=Coccinella septempunctata TaxID=41139 RepID=UPI001D069511|nr:MOXD1 homolog 1 [Coccinella septempunctata]
MKTHLLITTYLAILTPHTFGDLVEDYVKHVEKVNSQKTDKFRTFSEFDRASELRGRLRSRRRRHAFDPELDQWTHSEVLDKEGAVVLRWQPRHQEILFRVEARTRGYIGIGFSPNGGMEDADIVIGWVDDRNGRAFLHDCHGVPKGQGSSPIRDEVDNYTLEKGMQNETHTVLEFRRALDTCDIHDYVLNADTVRVIWAMRESDPQFEGDMVYHGESRGSQSLHLLGPPPVKRTENRNVKYWDITLENFEVKPNMNTIYWCKVFKAPQLDSKHHIIGYEPLIGPNHTNFVHHMIVHECQLGPNGNNQRWEAFAQQTGQLCYGQHMPLEWDKCLTPLVAWAIGAKGENFPPAVGVPIGQQRNSYYMLEIHYDNPQMKKARDTSGLRLHYTSELRPNDGGIMIAGVALSNLHFIPPKQKEYKTAGYCSTECTREVFPKEGVNVASVMLHSHLAGRKLKLRHIRAGKELPPLAQDNHYDFNYQQSRALFQNAVILPGDGLITECSYSTVDRTQPTLGGYSTKEEMCLAFILHYPRTELAGCYSMPPIQYFFQNLGVKEFYGKNMTEIETLFLQGGSDTAQSTSTTTSPLFGYSPGDEMSPEANRRAVVALQNARDYSIDLHSQQSRNLFDELIIKEPQEFQNKSFTTHLQNIPYSEPLLTKKMEEYFYTGLHLTFCRKRDDSLAIKETVEKFPNFSVYVNREKQSQCSYRNRKTVMVAGSSTSFRPNIILGFLFIVCSVVIYF